MAESADVLAGIGVIERMAAVGRREAELATIVDRANVLEDRVDRLEDAAFQFLELAELDGVVDAIVLHVVRVAGWLESSGAGHCVSIHVR